MSATSPSEMPVPEPHLEPEQMIARARALRPLVREEAEAAERRGYYSETLHKEFVKAGFYRCLQPRRFGGYEFSIRTFFKTIVEIASGDPGIGWCLCLASGHACRSGPISAQRRKRKFSALTAISLRLTRPAVRRPTLNAWPCQEAIASKENGATRRACLTRPTSWAWPRSRVRILAGRRERWSVSSCRATSSRCWTIGMTCSASKVAVQTASSSRMLSFPKNLSMKRSLATLAPATCRAQGCMGTRCIMEFSWALPPANSLAPRSVPPGRRSRSLRSISAQPNRCSPRRRFSNTSITTGSAFSVWPCR